LLLVSKNVFAFVSGYLYILAILLIIADDGARRTSSLGDM